MVQSLKDSDLNLVSGGAVGKKYRKEYKSLINRLVNLYINSLTEEEREELNKYAKNLENPKMKNGKKKKTKITPEN